MVYSIKFDKKKKRNLSFFGRYVTEKVSLKICYINFEKYYVYSIIANNIGVIKL